MKTTVIWPTCTHCGHKQQTGLDEDGVWVCGNCDTPWAVAPDDARTPKRTFVVEPAQRPAMDAEYERMMRVVRKKDPDMAAMIDVWRAKWMKVNRGEPGARAEIEAEVLRQDQRRAFDEMGRTGVPRHLIELAMATSIKGTETMTWLRSTWKTSPFVLLGGKPGTGKSFAATVMCMGLITTGKSVHWVECRQLSTYRWFDASAEEYRRKLYGVDLLVLDDLGVEYSKQTGPFLGELLSIIDRRQESKKSTVITTNLVEKDLRERYGERIWRRIENCPKRFFNQKFVASEHSSSPATPSDTMLGVQGQSTSG